MPESLVLKLEKKEPWLFFLITVFSCFPLLINQYFPSLDGPAHLYNAHITQELLRGNPFFENYLEFTPAPVPNWISNVLLITLTQFLPGYIAEKIMLLAYVILIPYSFRFLIHSLKGNTFISYYIFPFSYSALMMFGFYNFSWSVPISFLTLAYAFSISPRHGLKHYILLSFLLLLVYFSHVFMATIMMVILIGHPLADSIFSKDRRNLLKCLSTRLLAGGPMFILFIYYQLHQPESIKLSYVDATEIWRWIYTLRPLIAHKVDLESIFTTAIFILLILHLFIMMRYNQSKVLVFGKHSFFLLLPVLLLILVFFLPDGNGHLGYVTMRILYVFFVFILLAISFFSIPKGLQWGFVLCILMAHILLLARKNASIPDKATLYAELEEIAKSIKDYSILHPIDLSRDYRTTHISNYLGALKPLIITENYEAETTYFPLRWKKNDSKSRLDSVFVDNLGLPIAKSIPDCIERVDYILFIGTQQQLDSYSFEKLKRNYDLRKQTPHFILYSKI